MQIELFYNFREFYFIRIWCVRCNVSLRTRHPQICWCWYLGDDILNVLRVAEPVDSSHGGPVNIQLFSVDSCVRDA